jgi:hypothetical protein
MLCILNIDAITELIMTKSDLIEKILKDLGPFPLQNEPTYCDEPDYEEQLLATLQTKLADGVDIKTCEDFRHLGVDCCPICHGDYAHYEMSVIGLRDGSQAWVCDPVKYALNPQRNQS